MIVDRVRLVRVLEEDDVARGAVVSWTRRKYQDHIVVMSAPRPLKKRG